MGNREPRKDALHLPSDQPGEPPLKKKEWTKPALMRLDISQTQVGVIHAHPDGITTS